MSGPLPRAMTAIEIEQPGGPEVLRATRRALPEPRSGELLLEVALAGVNRPDCMQRAGRYAPPPGASDLPGLEVAGWVVAAGTDGEWCIGDAVCALTNGGGYAEFCAVPAAQCLPVPAGFTLAQAAALPENYFTVWSNLFQRGRLTAGETLLVHGGASGIGTTAIQLARAHRVRVIATAGSEPKSALCRRLGADRVVHYRSEDFVAVVDDFTGGAGADVILDMVGGDYTARNLEVLAEDGRLVQIAFLRGSSVTIDLLPVMVRRQTITGSTLRPQSPAAKAAIANSLRDRVWPLLESGKVTPVIDRTLNLTEAAEAHVIMEANENMGKLLLRVRDPD